MSTLYGTFIILTLSMLLVFYYAKKSDKSIYPIILYTLVTISLSWTVSSEDNVVVELESTSDLLKTVDHVDLSNVDYLKKVYSDSENDVAYYMYLNENHRISVGDTVTSFNDVSGIVTYTDVYGFCFDTKSDIPFGASGTGVFDVNDVQIGIISEVLEDGSVRCVWI